MAKRWSFEEDYIICKYCIEKQYIDIEYELLWELVDRLAEAGFDSRSSVVAKSSISVKFTKRNTNADGASRETPSALFLHMRCSGFQTVACQLRKVNGIWSEFLKKILFVV